MGYRSDNIDEKGLLFGKWCIKEGLWAITNRWQNFMYLLVGSEKALLIDTGYGEGNLREVVESITDLPVLVVNTHGHFDHSGGNGWWTEVFLAPEGEAATKQPFSPQQEAWYAAKPHRDYAIHPRHDGDVFDLGGSRTVEVLTIPAHHESSIALLDHGSRVLFTGDELEAGQVLLFVRAQNRPLAGVVAAHRANLQKLAARRAQYDFICPAHNGVMLQPDVYLNDFMALDDALLAGTAVPQPDTAGFGFAPSSKEAGFFERFGPLQRVQHGQASLVYQQEQREEI